MKNSLICLLTLVFLTSGCEKNSSLTSSPTHNDTNPITMQLAQNVANNFGIFNTRRIKKNARTGLKHIKETIAISDSVGQPAYYIINYESNQGFVIVSAEPKIVPILAYADEGQFLLDNINPGLGQWMKEVKQSIQIFRKNKNIKPIPGVDIAWKKYTNENVTTNYIEPSTDPPGNCNQIYTVSNMINTTWGQGSGYNASCPLKSDGPCGRAVTGCVATAMAQIMRYHNYPNSYS